MMKKKKKKELLNEKCMIEFGYEKCLTSKKGVDSANDDLHKMVVYGKSWEMVLEKKKFEWGYPKSK